MKKLLIYFFALLAISTSMFSCTEDDDDNQTKKEEQIKMYPETMLMGIGDGVTIKAKVYNSENTKIIWDSEDESIATVSENGEITGVSEGTTSITAKNATGLIATCKVTVSPIIPKSISIDNPDKIKIFIEEELELFASVLPSNASQIINWESSNEDVAIVEDGIVTGIGVGNVTIKASTSNGLSSKVKLTVEFPPYKIAPEMVGTLKCVKLQARGLEDGTIYEEDNMDKLFKIEGVTKEEWCQRIKDGMAFRTNANNTIVWSVALKGGKSKDIIGTIDRNINKEGELLIDYHIDETGINFGDRSSEYSHIRLVWLPETSNVIYDEPGGSFYDLIYTCEVVKDGITTIKPMTQSELNSFKCAK